MKEILKERLREVKVLWLNGEIGLDEVFVSLAFEMETSEDYEEVKNEISSWNGTMQEP